MEYLNLEGIEGISAEAFQNQRPYPWVNIPGTLTPQGYERLRETLPDVSTFIPKIGHTRAYGQGSHDRCILHYRPGIDVPDPWREFIAELHGKSYDAFLRRMFGLSRRKHLIFTMEWYYAWQGCCVTPHCDAARKLATHIFYFNTKTDWKDDWGGDILILNDEGRCKTHSGPDFKDLRTAAALDPRKNGSLLFKRTAHSWHGVRPLRAPPGQLRKLFIITVNVPTWQVIFRRLRGKDPDGYSLKAKAA